MMIIRPEIQDLPPYIPGRSIEGGIKLSSNENALGSSPRAMSALRAALEPGAVELNRYPDGGAKRLRERIADYWKLSADEVLLGNGSDEIMVMIAGAFITGGLNAITGKHTFSQYTFATTIFGGTVRYCSMDDGRFDLDEMVGLVDDDTRVIFICNPNNPTGAGITHDELVRFLARTPRHVVVVLDEAYGEFATEQTYPRTTDLMRDYPNLIRLRTFSKIYGLAGLRIGYATGQAGLIDAVARLRQPFNVDSLAQHAAAAALSDRDFVEKSISNVRVGRSTICRTLEELGIPFMESEANFVCAYFAHRAADVVEHLAGDTISVRPLASFGLPEHIRISVGSPSEVEAFCASLRDCAGTWT